MMKSLSEFRKLSADCVYRNEATHVHSEAGIPFKSTRRRMLVKGNEHEETVAKQWQNPVKVVSNSADARRHRSASSVMVLDRPIG